MFYKESRIYHANKGEDYNEKYYLKGRIFYRNSYNDSYPELIRVILLRNADLIVVEDQNNKNRFVITSKELQDNYTSIRPHYTIAALELKLGRKLYLFTIISNYIDENSSNSERQNAKMNIYINGVHYETLTNFSSSINCIQTGYEYIKRGLTVLKGISIDNDFELITPKLIKFKSFHCYINDSIENIFWYMCYKKMSNPVIDQLTKNIDFSYLNDDSKIKRILSNVIPKDQIFLMMESRPDCVYDFPDILTYKSEKSIDYIINKVFKDIDNCIIAKNNEEKSILGIQELFIPNIDNIYITKYDYEKDLSLLYIDKTFRVIKVKIFGNYDFKHKNTNYETETLLIRYRYKDMETILEEFNKNSYSCALSKEDISIMKDELDKNSYSCGLSKEEMEIFLTNKF